jgi:hypothetical protein
MSYDAHISITVPASLADVAALVGRAMDPDTGGAESFVRDVLEYVDGEPVYADTITCSTVCRSAFKARALAMLADPAILFYACAQDYAQRWPDMTPPTLEQCQAFVAAATVR